MGPTSYRLIFAEGARIQIGSINPATLAAVFSFIGLWWIYTALCELFNTTTILLKDDKVTFWTKPFSLSTRKAVDVADIANFSLERAKNGTDNGRKVFKHYVSIKLKNGNLIRLCKVRDMNEAAYVEKLLEDKLGLKDDANLDQIAF